MTFPDLVQPPPAMMQSTYEKVDLEFQSIFSPSTAWKAPDSLPANVGCIALRRFHSTTRPTTQHISGGTKSTTAAKNTTVVE